MYIVRNKKNQEILHINPAPLCQELAGKDVYYGYDGETMEIGKTDLTILPEHFVIDAQGYIRELSLEKKLKKGLIQLRPEQKIEGGQIVDKTLSEKIREGLLMLEPSQKLVFSGDNEVIVDKTPSELVTEGIIQLSPYQKIIGQGTEERIVDKSPEELVAAGLLKLTPNQRLEEGKIVTYSNEEMLDQGCIDLAEYKRRKLDECSELSFELREEIVPEYKLVNSALGIYDEEEANRIKATVQAFREEYYIMERQVEAAKDVLKIQAATESYFGSVIELKNKMMGKKNGK
jgi:hypothetical protein